MYIDRYTRAIEEAKFIINTKGTVRSAAKEFGVGKTTVHRDIEMLRQENHSIYFKVKQIIDENARLKSIRGALATKEKYRRLKNEKE